MLKRIEHRIGEGTIEHEMSEDEVAALLVQKAIDAQPPASPFDRLIERAESAKNMAELRAVVVDALRALRGG